MKKVLVALAVLASILVFSSCDNNIDGDGLKPLTKEQVISRTWIVTAANFGREIAPAGMYANYSISFTEDGTYSVVNPDGVPSPNLTSSNSGNWDLNLSETQIVFDGGSDLTVPVQLVYVEPAAKSMEWEWDVQLPGKVRTKYEFTLVPAQ